MNLVLACVACNRAQGNLYHADAFAQNRFAPFQWDAFVGLVQGCGTMRKFKKKILCTQSEDDAAVMVQNKTALQETAWIAKLARVLVSLKFGWRLDSKDEERRVVVVTGTVTNRVAKKYGLYSLLGGPERIRDVLEQASAIDLAIAEVSNAADDTLQGVGDALAEARKNFKKRKGETLWERDHMLWLLNREKIKNRDELGEKDREDSRHHALDALILSFLPHWSGDPGKSLYFGLPPGRDWKEEFRSLLGEVQAESLRFERPVLRETIYGLRPNLAGGLFAAIRREVFPMAYGGSTPDGKLTKFDAKNIQAKLSTIRDPRIAAKLSEIAADLQRIDNLKHRERAWHQHCQSLRLSPGGPLIKKVSCWSDKPEPSNYKNMAKDWTPEREEAGRGQWRCAKGSHQGQWVYLDTNGKPRIRAVKVFESVSEVKAAVQNEPDCIEILMFLQSGCVVKIDGVVRSGKKELEAGNYRLGGVEEGARKLDLYSAGGTKYAKIPLTTLLSQGFRRIT